MARLPPAFRSRHNSLGRSRLRSCATPRPGTFFFIFGDINATSIDPSFKNYNLCQRLGGDFWAPTVVRFLGEIGETRTSPNCDPPSARKSLVMSLSPSSAPWESATEPINTSESQQQAKPTAHLRSHRHHRNPAEAGQWSGISSFFGGVGESWSVLVSSAPQERGCRTRAGPALRRS